MLKVALTGGIGSGKSTIARFFEELGIPVFYSDSEAKLVYEDADIRKQINELAGIKIFDSEGKMNRELFAKNLFQNPDFREKINQLVHPEVRKRFALWCEKQEGKVPFVLNEAALHIESGSYKKFDKLILVTAPEDIRIERITKRDGINLVESKKRIASQMPDSEKLKVADFVIENVDLNTSKAKVLELFQKLSKKDTK